MKEYYNEKKEDIFYMKENKIKNAFLIKKYYIMKRKRYLSYKKERQKERKKEIKNVCLI